jgi:hypothetical protein
MEGLMKRDMDLIRNLLLEIEDSDRPVLYISHFLGSERFQDVEQAVLEYHFRLLIEAGFLDADRKQGISTVGSWYIRHLTWEGHEFLGTIRDPEIWRRTKEGASAAGGWSVGFIRDVGTAYLKLKAKEVLGLDLN